MKNEPKQIKSAGGVVVNSKGEILVVSQLYGDGKKSWCLPKGHVDDGEDDLEAAKREIHEESGVSDLEFVKKLGTYQRYKNGDDPSELKTITIFLFKTNQMDLKPIDPGNPEAVWVNKEDVANLLTYAKDKEFFLSIKEKI